MARPVSPISFVENLQSLRSSYQKRRDNTNLCPPFKRPIIDLDVETVNRYTYWYEGQDSKTRCLRLYDVPGSLSGRILRLYQDLPGLPPGDFEIDGDVVRPLNSPPSPPGEPENDSENVTELLDLLPTVTAYDDAHFTKKPRYRSEIENLLKCQGGKCPGSPISPYVIHLLGKTTDGLLVFPRHIIRPYVVGSIHPVSVYKSWFIQLVEGVRALHGIGIVHHDLRLDNLVFSQDHTRIIIIDLESRWGNRAAPEILPTGLEAGWSPRSDVWDIGECIRCVLFGNAPVNHTIEWNVAPPFAEVVEACQRTDPVERASLDQLIVMLEAI